MDLRHTEGGFTQNSSSSSSSKSKESSSMSVSSSGHIVPIVPMAMPFTVPHPQPPTGPIGFAAPVGQHMDASFAAAGHGMSHSVHQASGAVGGNVQTTHHGGSCVTTVVTKETHCGANCGANHAGHHHEHKMEHHGHHAGGHHHESHHVQSQQHQHGHAGHFDPAKRVVCQMGVVQGGEVHNLHMGHSHVKTGHHGHDHHHVGHHGHDHHHVGHQHGHSGHQHGQCGVGLVHAPIVLGMMNCPQCGGTVDTCKKFKKQLKKSHKGKKDKKHKKGHKKRSSSRSSGSSSSSGSD